MSTHEQEPIPCEKSPRWIMSAASVLAKQMKFERRGNIEKLVTDLKGTVVEVESSELKDCVAYITVPGNDRNFEIKVAKNLFPLQRRYAIAHDLGHYVLHSKFGEYQLTASASPLNSAGSRAEYEAHLFASALLMPESELRELQPPSTSEVAAHFQVPLHVAGEWIDYLNSLNFHEAEIKEKKLHSTETSS